MLGYAIGNVRQCLHEQRFLLILGLQVEAGQKLRMTTKAVPDWLRTVL